MKLLNSSQRRLVLTLFCVFSGLWVQPVSSETLIYSNSFNSGLFYPPGPYIEVVDYGASPGGNVTKFTIGYSTNLSNPGTIIIRFYDWVNEYTDPDDAVLLRNFQINNLPGNGTYCQDYLIPTQNQFTLHSGDFGYSYELRNSSTGPTIAAGGTGNQDKFWMYDDFFDMWKWASFEDTHSGFYMKIYTAPPEPEEDPNVCDIEGYKFDDADGNGLWGPDEAGLADWMIFLDTNTNGQYDAGEPNAMTDLEGHYEFLEIDPGTYTVAEVMQTGWTQTLPGGDGTYQIIAEPNQVYLDNNFGNTTQPLTVTLSGHVTMDDGTAIEGWQLDLDLDGNIFTAEMSTTTDPLGYYQFDLEVPWTGTLLLQLPDRWYSHWATLRQNITTDIIDNFVCYYQYDAGDGTAGDPYQIRTAEQLNMIGHMPSQWDNYFVLTSDIDLAGTTYSNAIIPSFSGQFDGAGFSVLNLQSHSGLFGYIKNAVIKNLGVENVEITNASSVGAICTDNHGGTIENCFSTGNISGFHDIGGICAWVHKEYIDDPPIGPLPPINTPVIKNCYSTVNVTVNLPNLIPFIYTHSAGGLCAYAEGAELFNNYACGSVDATGRYLSDINFIIDNGGLVGHIENCNVYNNYSSGHVVDGRDYSNPGGFCGSVSGDSSTFAGNFWDNTVNPSLQGIGNAADPYGVIGESTANMQTETTFTDAGWDFSTPVWTIWEGVYYPRLAWENALSGDFGLDHQWMYQNVLSGTKSRLTADVLITDDPLANSSYTYEWEIILPGDVTTAPSTFSGGGSGDLSWTFAAPGCDEPGGISGLGETFQVKVTVTGNDHGNTGSAQLQFGIALLGDVNNDKLVDIADCSITNAFWRNGFAGPFTLRDCDVNCDDMIDIADRSITNAIWRGRLGSNSITNSCPLR